MHQREATNIVIQLAPELAQGDPAVVFSKYARTHNLAPAQLQRLGNVFNTMSVLVQQDKDKSAAPYLIDVPDMVQGYLDNYKAASAVSIFDDEASKQANGLADAAYNVIENRTKDPDAQRAGESPGDYNARKLGITREQAETLNTAPAKDHDKLMAGFKPPTPPPFVGPPAPTKTSSANEVFSWLEKAPAPEAQMPKQSEYRDYKREMELGVEVARDGLSYLQELIPQQNVAFAKLAANMLMDTEDPQGTFNTLIRDYDMIENQNNGDVLRDGGFSDKLARAFKDKGVDVTYSKPDPPILIRDHTGHMGEAVKAAALLEEVDTLWSVVENGTSLAVAHKDKLASNLYARRGVEQLMRELKLIGAYAGDFKEAAAQRQDEDRPKSRRDPSSPFGEFVGATVDEIRPDGSVLRGSGAALGAGAYGVVESGQHVAKAFRDLPGMWNQFTTEGETGKALDSLFGQNNRAKVQGDRMDLERVQQEAEAVAVLQKLILQDEILSRKDPQMVYEAWQTIRRSSPEVATDTSLLRMMLRTAVETQGVDIDSASAARKFEHGSYKNELVGSNRNQPVSRS